MYNVILHVIWNQQFPLETQIYIEPRNTSRIKQSNALLANSKSNPSSSLTNNCPMRVTRVLFILPKPKRILHFNRSLRNITRVKLLVSLSKWNLVFSDRNRRISFTMKLSSYWQYKYPWTAIQVELFVSLFCVVDKFGEPLSSSCHPLQLPLACFMLCEVWHGYNVKFRSETLNGFSNVTI